MTTKFQDFSLEAVGEDPMLSWLLGNCDYSLSSNVIVCIFEISNFDNLG